MTNMDKELNELLEQLEQLEQLELTEQELLGLNHYKNFQPLWAEEYITKSSIHEGIRHRRR